MNAKQIRQQLMDAFGVTTSKELKLHLRKTDLRNKAELLHAAAVVWNYGRRYEVKNVNAIERILKSQDQETQRKLTIDAKHGFGYYDACVAV